MCETEILSSKRFETKLSHFRSNSIQKHAALILKFGI